MPGVRSVAGGAVAWCKWPFGSRPTVGPLARAAGLAGVPPVGHPEESTAAALLAATAEAFLRSGGFLTLDDYAAMGQVERAAAVVAAERVSADRAASLGLATQGPLGAACALAPADGGSARRRVMLQAAAAAASPRRRP